MFFYIHLFIKKGPAPRAGPQRGKLIHQNNSSRACFSRGLRVRSFAEQLSNDENCSDLFSRLERPINEAGSDCIQTWANTCPLLLPQSRNTSCLYPSSEYLLRTLLCPHLTLFKIFVKLFAYFLSFYAIA